MPFLDDLPAATFSPDRSLAEAARLFDAAREAARRAVQPDTPKVVERFEVCLEIKTRLDELERFRISDAGESESESAQQYALTALFLHYEYQIHRLNASTPLRQMPFLVHWVETLRRWQPLLRLPDAELRRQFDGDVLPDATFLRSWKAVHAARVGLIQRILRRRDGEDLAALVRRTPRELAAELRDEAAKPLDITPYVRILEDDEIYDKPDSSSAGAEAARPCALPTPPSSSDSSALQGIQAEPQPQPHHQQQREEKKKENEEKGTPPSPPPAPPPTLSPLDETLLNLERDPAGTLHALTHLPLDIPSLDLLTTLLLSPRLPTLPQPPDPTVLICNYLQHCLRTLERHQQHQQRGQGVGGPSLSPPDPDDELDATFDLPRAVRLLVLFVKNALRRGLIVPPAAVFFECQELTVRFVWVPEARALRRWLEEGSDEEGEEEEDGEE